MLILGIDTSSKICSCAIFDSEIGVLAEINLQTKNNHSAIVMPAINNLFNFLNLKPNNIDKFAVSIGPGSFTGTRIGLGIAKGMAMALKKSLVSVSNLEILEKSLAVLKYNNSFEIIPLIDAKNKRVYYRYKNENNVADLDEFLKGLPSDKDYIFTGDGAINYKDSIKEILGDKVHFSNFSNSISRAALLCEISLSKKESNIYTLEPDYISKSRAERYKNI